MNTIKTWQERTGNHNIRPGSAKHMIAEIAELRAALAARATPAQPTEKPLAWLATDLDGHGDVAFTKEEAKRRAGESCTYFYPLYDTDKPQPSPSSVGAAIRALLLPEPFMTMRFNAKASRWDEVRGEAFTSDTRVYSQGQVNEIRAAAAALAEQVPASEDAKFLTWVKAHRPSWIREWRRQLPAVSAIAQDGQTSEADHG